MTDNCLYVLLCILMKSKNRHRKRAAKLRPCLKIWLEKDGRYAFGGGVAQALKAIQKTGSIKQAATLVNQSYRYMWGKVKKTEKALGIILIQTTMGGQNKERTQLTEFAKRIVDPYLRLEITIDKYLNNAFERVVKQINKKGERKYERQV